MEIMQATPSPKPTNARWPEESKPSSFWRVWILDLFGMPLYLISIYLFIRAVVARYNTIYGITPVQLLPYHPTLIISGTFLVLFCIAYMCGYTCTVTELPKDGTLEDAIDCTNANIKKWESGQRHKLNGYSIFRFLNPRCGSQQKFAQYLAIPGRGLYADFSRKKNLDRVFNHIVLMIVLPQIAYGFYTVYEPKPVFNIVMKFISVVYAVLAVAEWLDSLFLGLHLGWSLKMGQHARQIRKECLRGDLEEGEAGGQAALDRCTAALLEGNQFEENQRAAEPQYTEKTPLLQNGV